MKPLQNRSQLPMRFFPFSSDRKKEKRSSRKTFFHPSAYGHRLLTVVTITSTNTNECRSKHLSTFNFQYLFFVFKKKGPFPQYTRTHKDVKAIPGFPAGHPRIRMMKITISDVEKSREKKFMILSTQPPEPRKWIRMMRRTQPMTPKGKGINKKVQEKE